MTHLARRNRIGFVLLASVLWASSVTFAQPKVTIKVPTPEGHPAGSAYTMPNNFYGAHLLVDDGAVGTRGYKHLQWARHLVGRWGYAKTLVFDIDPHTQGPRPGWVDYVNTCYQLELIPLMRLGGKIRNGQWVKPEPDAPGDYTSLAAAIKRVVQGLPRSDMCPLYIEVWNEPNLAVEWSGEPNAKEFADFFVQAAAVIHSIGDDRIRVVNGGLATSPDFAEQLCKANLDFINAFDIWASHPYPQNTPSHITYHDKTADANTHHTLDSHLLELDVLKRFGRDNVKVMITETGYDLGNSTLTRSAGWPIIDEYNRADYMMRAFRDEYPKWPEVVAVFPFEFCNEGWQRFDWVYPDSDINPDGSPTKPHYQYSVVAALAKPTDSTGAISGTITIAKLGSRLEGAKVLPGYLPQGALTDPMGDFVLPRLAPGEYRISIEKEGFTSIQKKLTVAAGANAVLDVALEAMQRRILTGEVRSGDDGKPLSGVKVTLEPGGQNGRTNRDGRYEIKEVIPARYTLKAELRQHYPYEAVNVEVSSRRESRHDFTLGKMECPPQGNMLNNPSMEAGGGGGGKEGVALGFEPLVPATPDYKEGLTNLLDRYAHTGRWSQAMNIAAEETSIRQITHYGTAKPGTTYVAGAWVRTDSADKDAAAWISLAATRNDGGVIHGATSRKKVTGRSDGWTWLEVTATAPADSQRLSFNLHTQGKSGTAYFDDVYLGEVRK